MNKDTDCDILVAWQYSVTAYSIHLLGQARRAQQKRDTITAQVGARQLRAFIEYLPVNPEGRQQLQDVGGKTLCCSISAVCFIKVLGIKNI